MPFLLQYSVNKLSTLLNVKKIVFVMSALVTLTELPSNWGVGGVGGGVWISFHLLYDKSYILSEMIMKRLEAAEVKSSLP